MNVNGIVFNELVEDYDRRGETHGVQIKLKTLLELSFHGIYLYFRSKATTARTGTKISGSYL